MPFMSRVYVVYEFPYKQLANHNIFTQETACECNALDMWLRSMFALGLSLGCE